MTALEDALVAKIGCRHVHIYAFPDREEVGVYAWWQQPDGSPVVHGIRCRATDFVSDSAAEDAVVSYLRGWWQENHATNDD